MQASTHCKVALYSFVADIVSVVFEREKELQTCYLSQLEACLQCGSMHVHNDYGKSIRITLLMRQRSFQWSVERNSCLLCVKITI